MTDQTARIAHPTGRQPGSRLAPGRWPEAERMLAALAVMVEGESGSGGGALLVIHAQVTPCLDRLAGG